MSVLLNPEFVKIEDVVPCVVHHHKGEGHEHEVTDPRTKEKRKSCDLYPSIPCEAHNYSVSLSYSGTPASFVCMPDGAPFAKPEDGKWGGSVNGISTKLGEAQQKLGRPFPRALYDRIVRDASASEKAIADGHAEKSVGALVKWEADKHLTPAIREGRLKPWREGLEKKGEELLEAAKAKHESDADGALKAARDVSAKWKGLEIGKKAQDLVKEWEGAKKA